MDKTIAYETTQNYEMASSQQSLKVVANAVKGVKKAAKKVVRIAAALVHHLQATQRCSPNWKAASTHDDFGKLASLQFENYKLSKL